VKKILYLSLFTLTLFIVACSNDDPIPALVVVAPVVVVPDTGAPTITLVGSSTINLEEGDSYTDAGASAADEVDGDISTSITTSGSVDTSTPGTYTLTYNVSDAAGNSVSLSRTVIVAVATRITELGATGRVSEQTPAEARSTINGKWNFPESSAKSAYSSKASNTCDFDFIEFTDTTYFLGIKLTDVASAEKTDYAVSGQYELNEDSEGNVSSVDLYYFTGEVDVVIATLTDINVVEVNGEIDATFTINLTIPDTATFEACNELSATYSDVGKEEPMQQSYAVANTSTSSAVANTSTSSAVANTSTSSDSTSNTASNTYVSYVDPISHVTLINNTWSLQGVTEEGESLTIAEIFERWCNGGVANTSTSSDSTSNTASNTADSYVDDCSPPTSINLQFSAYGSYNLVFSGGSEGTSVDAGKWIWIDEPGTPKFYLIEDDYREVMKILDLSESLLILRTQEGDTYRFAAL